MGRHSQTSSLSTTLSGLGSMAARKRTASGVHGRRRAEGPAKTALTPMLFKAGGAAAAFSLAVSGAAYAAISAGDDEGHSSSGGSFGLIGGESEAKPTASEAQGSGKIASAEVSTTTVDEPQVHGTVQKESDALPAGQTQVETPGVDGLVRTTYEVTTQDGKEISRTAVAQVVVTQKVDEVVLVGTGAQQAQQDAAAAQQQAQQDAATQQQAAQSNEGAAPSAPAPAADPGAGTDPESAKAIARSMMSGYGWSDSEFSCLENLWNRESSWNYQAQNASSGAYGIPQALPGAKMSEVADDWATNPSTQITWGLGYISGRYGTPCSAWAHSESVGWY
ncbi:G5 domain-containing protein [uncultured Actinomyces sp.]|uniref:G5 domain-containing protein n=1 Tax=uncultured Actinomyces sp. TaxID=249061 RepID=UPI0025DDA34A|nr:G5 domain-containing protein [uncultured Actinomyces sp.]